MDINEPSNSGGIRGNCCIHLADGNVTEDTKRFTAITFKKCQIALVCRRKYGMKYDEIQFPYPRDFSQLKYHSSCYRKFTAIKKEKVETITNSDIESFFLPESSEEGQTEKKAVQDIQAKNTPRATRTINTFLENRRTGVVKNACIFCNKLFIYKNKKRIVLSSCETKNFEENIKQYAIALNDQQLLAKIRDVDFIAKEIKYHRLCRVNYSMKLKKQISKKNKQGEWYAVREYHNIALGKLKEFIKINILENQDAYFLSSIYRIYMQYLFESSEDTTVNRTSNFTIAHLLRKLRYLYKDYMAYTKYKGKYIIHSRNIDSQAAVHICISKSKTIENEIVNVAFTLRKEILKIKKNRLPDQITLGDLYKGECTIPSLVHTFFRNLISGPFHRRLEVNEKVRTDSLAQDAIYTVTNGRIKTSKHIELGMCIKSLTGSRKVTNILNRLGHSISYSAVEELETELTYSSFERQFATPYGIHQKPDLATGLAFDNFDRFVETLSGKDTLHDTVGIIYQHKTDATDIPEAVSDDRSTLTSATSSQRKRRKMFDVLEEEIEPYRKKPKLNATVNIPSLVSLNQNKYNHIRQLDNLWVMTLALLESEIPMWVGWNNPKTLKTLPVQNICYLPPINESPTSLSVVAHTLNVAQNIALGCKQSYISVTYDLAIAKLAMQIQNEERPKYNNIFIQLGAFHIQMSYFKAVGKYIEESGGPYILTESGILAAGSLKGFLTETHYNRCKRVHPMFAAALQVLHFREFLQKSDVCVNDIINELIIIQKQKVSEHQISDRLGKMLDDYGKYYQETETGAHGMTAKYWIIYINFIKLFQEFSRSIRTGDFDLYVSCLPQIATLMFSMNHPNYARWIVRFYNNLINVENTHPGLKQTLVQGGISIRRTEKSFSGSPIDLTLEQTINADAANKLTGISSFTNSISARRRWAASHSLRTSIVTHLLNTLNLNSGEDVTNDLRSSKIKKDNVSLQQLTAQICSTLNPFSSDTLENDELVNLATGKRARQETKNFLLNIITKGESLRDGFIAECNEDSSRFENPIPRQVIYTFASENKFKSKKSDGKVAEVRVERNLMGRLLVLALENKIDLSNVLSYPLTTVPLSLSHIDGSMNKTDKAKLLKVLENRVPPSSAPSPIDCIIFDGFFLLHILGDIPLTYGRLAIHILKKVCKTSSKRIELIFDKCVIPSIKDVERDRRAGVSGRSNVFSIVGEDQKRPNDFLKALRNDSFKSELVKFLVSYWKSNNILGILNDKIFRVNCEDVCYMFYEDVCYMFYEHDGNIRCEIDQYLCCNHSEADTRIIYHISKLPEFVKNVVVRASDTDIIIIALGNMHKLTNVRMWIECGLKSKNTLRYICVNDIYLNLGPTLSKALPAYHALTGCDYTAAFARKGKIKPLTILEKDIKTSQIFASFGNSEELSEEQVDCVEKFVCHMYGRNNMTRVNEVRFDLFLKNHGRSATNQHNPLAKIKNFDGSLMPPCSNSLICKSKRVNQICAIWNFATEPQPKFFKPEENGWILIDDKYQVEWFVGPQSPMTLEEISQTSADQPVSDVDDEDGFYNPSSDEED